MKNATRTAPSIMSSIETDCNGMVEPTSRNCAYCDSDVLDCRAISSHEVLHDKQSPCLIRGCDTLSGNDPESPHFVRFRRIGLRERHCFKLFEVALSGSKTTWDILTSASY
jgi:hypothetical protein